MQNDPELELAIFMAHGKINTFISVNRVKDEVVDNPDKFPILSKETVKTMIARIQTKMCTMGALIPHDDALFEREHRLEPHDL